MSRRIVAVWRMSLFAAVLAGTATAAHAQEPAPAEGATREAVIEQEQAEKVQTLHPYVPTRAEADPDKAEDILQQAALQLASVLRQRVLGRRLHAGRGLQALTSAPYNTIDVRGSYTITGYKRIEAEFIAPRLFNRARHAVAARRLARGDAGGLLRHRQSTRRRTIARTTFQQPYASATAHDLPERAALCCCAAGVECLAVEAAARRRAASRRSRPCTRRTRCPAWAPSSTYLHTQGTVGFDWRTSPGYTRRGGFYGVTVHDYTRPRRGLRVPAGRLRGDPAHSDPARGLGHLASRAACRRRRRRTASRSRSSCCRRSAAARRCAASRAGGSAIATACCCRPSGASWSNRFLDTAFFYDAGKVTARTVGSGSRWPEERLRLRRPLPRAVRHAAPHRTGEEQRRPRPRVLGVAAF